MGGPFSLAASAAGLVTISGTISNRFYQFCYSIYDVPAIAQNTTKSLYTLDVALRHIEKDLLPTDTFATMDSEDPQSLEICLKSCRSVVNPKDLKPVEAKVQTSRLASLKQRTLNEALASAKAFFSENQMQEFLSYVEREKWSLLILNGVCSA